MVLEEFVDKYYPVGKSDLHQVIWDLMSWVEDQTYGPEAPNEDLIGSIKYEVHNLLEICRPDVKDYVYLKNMQSDLTKIEL